MEIILFMTCHNSGWSEAGGSAALARLGTFFSVCRNVEILHSSCLASAHTNHRWRVNFSYSVSMRYAFEISRHVKKEASRHFWQGIKKSVRDTFSTGLSFHTQTFFEGTTSKMNNSACTYIHFLFVNFTSFSAVECRCRWLCCHSSPIARNEWMDGLMKRGSRMRCTPPHIISIYDECCQ